MKTRTRIALAFLAAFVVTLAALALLRHGHKEDATALTSTIAGKIAALNLPQRTVELPTEKARRARRHQDRRLRGRRQGLCRRPGEQPDRELALLPVHGFHRRHLRSRRSRIRARARCLDCAGRQRRGGPARPRAVLFRCGLGPARGGLQQQDAGGQAGGLPDLHRQGACRLRGRDRTRPGKSYAFYLRLRILHGLGASQQMAGAFQQAIGRYPGYYPLYTIMLQTLQPKWGGDVPSMYALVDRYAGSAPKDSPLKLLYVALYRDLLETAFATCDSAGNDAAKLAACVSAPRWNARSPRGLRPPSRPRCSSTIVPTSISSASPSK